jgi:hypothetical protein
VPKRRLVVADGVADGVVVPLMRGRLCRGPLCDADAFSSLADKDDEDGGGSLRLSKPILLSRLVQSCAKLQGLNGAKTSSLR